MRLEGDSMLRSPPVGRGSNGWCITPAYKQLDDTQQHSTASVRFLGSWSTRLLDHVDEVLADSQAAVVADQILGIGGKIEEILLSRAGLALSPGPPDTFRLYLGHVAIMRLVIKEGARPSISEHEYYPRKLNQDVKDGFAAIQTEIDSLKRANATIVSAGKKHERRWFSDVVRAPGHSNSGSPTSPTSFGSILASKRFPSERHNSRDSACPPPFITTLLSELPASSAYVEEGIVFMKPNDQFARSSYARSFGAYVL